MVLKFKLLVKINDKRLSTLLNNLTIKVYFSFSVNGISTECQPHEKYSTFFRDRKLYQQ